MSDYNINNFSSKGSSIHVIYLSHYQLITCLQKNCNLLKLDQFTGLVILPREECLSLSIYLFTPNYEHKLPVDTWLFILCMWTLSLMELGWCTATTLTSWHLLVTFCSLHVALLMKLFEHKPFDARAVMGFGILNGISIGLLNLSLGFNSVGFYQVKSHLWAECVIHYMAS